MSVRIHIKARVNIDERPAVVDTKARFGDWNRDIIVGKDGKGTTTTPVERTSKKLLAAKSPKGVKNAKSVARLVLQPLPPLNSMSLPSQQTMIPSSQHTNTSQKGCTSKPLSPPIPPGRKVLPKIPTNLYDATSPKGTYFSPVSDDYVLHVQTELNLRTRILLSFSPANQNILFPLHDHGTLDS